MGGGDVSSSRFVVVVEDTKVVKSEERSDEECLSSQTCKGHSVPRTVAGLLATSRTCRRQWGGRNQAGHRQTDLHQPDEAH